jgi:hypothetical protein
VICQGFGDEREYANMRVDDERGREEDEDEEEEEGEDDEANEGGGCEW